MGNLLSIVFGAKNKKKHGHDLSFDDFKYDDKQMTENKSEEQPKKLKQWIKEMYMVIRNSEFLIDTDVSLQAAVCVVLLLYDYMFVKDKDKKRPEGRKSIKKESLEETKIEFPMSNEDETDYPIKRPVQIEEPIRKEIASSSQYSSPVTMVTLKMDDTTDFPFFQDERTISHIKSSQTMFIMRGISGSGKSTLVNFIQKIYPEAVVCSADFYFVKKDGNYCFQQDLLPYAHGDCQDEAKDACFQQKHVIVIDNTNIRRWEMKPYLDMARNFNYVVILVRPRTKWREDPYELSKRNKHGVGIEVIENKIRKFEDIIPFYYGWFLNKTDSAFLYRLGTSYLETFFNNFPKFTKRWFWEDTDITLSMLQQYFSIEPHESSFRLHCTAFYCGSRRNPTQGREEYHQSEKVQRSCGQVYQLHITGITISPRTLTARIRLSSDQLSLLRKPEEIERNEMIYNKKGFCSKDSENYPQKGRCVHVTLATASGIGASQANFDLLDICDKEYFLSTTGRPVPTCTVDRGIMKCLDDEYCVIYFDTPLLFNAVFSGLY